MQAPPTEDALGVGRTPLDQLGDDERLESREAGELFIDARRRVVAVDESISEGQPARALGFVDLPVRQ